MSDNRFSSFLRSYALALSLLSVILTSCFSSSASATPSPSTARTGWTITAPPSDVTGRLSGPTHRHPTPLRIFLVQAEYVLTPGQPSSLPNHNGYFRVTRSNGAVFRLGSCIHEDSDNCVWDASRSGNRRGRSFATINGTTRYFPTRMLATRLHTTAVSR